MYVCGDDGHKPYTLREVRRKARSYEIHDRLGAAVSDLLHHCIPVGNTCNRTSRLHNVRILGRYHVARFYKHLFGKIPTGGTAMFALLAMAGDLGGALGPAIVGNITQRAGDDMQKGMLAGCAFPLILMISLLLLNRARRRNN